MTNFAAVATILFATISICGADNAYEDYDEELVDYVANDTSDKPPILLNYEMDEMYEYEIPDNNLGNVGNARKSSWKGPDWAEKYTLSKRGCPCWWDLTLGNICACCKKKGWRQGVPCGYPLHNFCQPKTKNSKTWGCKGLIPNKAGLDYERYTLSTRGYPCHYDKSDRSCAWCVPGAQQCGKAKTWANKVLDRNLRMKPYWKKENTCLPVLNSDRKSYAKSPRIICIGKPQDCSQWPNDNSECNVNADCVDTGITKEVRKGKIWNVHRCACKPGFVGNGITCANETTGLVTIPGVKLTTKLTTDVWEQYKLDTSVEVSNNDDFMDSLDTLLGGGDCGAGCAQDVVTCPA